jgi:hypothetical protein
MLLTLSFSVLLLARASKAGENKLAGIAAGSGEVDVQLIVDTIKVKLSTGLT